AFVSITQQMGTDLLDFDSTLARNNGEIPDKERLIDKLKKAISGEDLTAIKQDVRNILFALKQKSKTVEGLEDYLQLGLSFESLVESLEQALDAYSLERCKYYLRRLIKSLTSEKIGKINDLNMNRWKEYEDIITDSLWIMHKRDRTGAHNAGYWGNFIPQIPQQLLKRYTKKKDWVLDTFLGSGTTLIECQRLERNAIGIDLSVEALKAAQANLDVEKNASSSKIKLVNADSTEISYKELLEKYNISSVQLVIMHPPYWDIIKFSEHSKDLSNAPTVESFLQE
ncbi:DNA methylase N-4/N-6 domain-containing protein, partial [mine drainage metagenome]